jgi:branched-chain amino acid transport system permease protein
MSLQIFFQLLISGLSVGSIYALVAVALVIPFKASSILNFAQGEMVAVGAYAGLVLSQSGMPYVIVFLGSMLIGLVFGLAIERLIIRRIMAAAEFTLVIATFAVGLLIQSCIRLYWQDNLFTIDDPMPIHSIRTWGLVLNVQYLWVILCTTVLIVGLAWFFKFNRIGKAMRAVSMHHSAARLMGIHVERILMFSWGLSGAIGAMSGILLAPIIGINPEIGHLILKALVAAVIGGFTSLPGAFVGGLLLGLIETYSGALFGSTLKNILPFILLVVFLLIKPYGLFGKAPLVRV